MIKWISFKRSKGGSFFNDQVDQFLVDVRKSAGYSERDIPKLILGNNLYGLDIDDRAAQLAYFAVMMKARSKSRSIFRENVSLNLCAIQESNGISDEAIDFFTNGMDEKFKAEVDYLIKVFHDAKEYGSILEVEKVDFDAIKARLADLEKRSAGKIDERIHCIMIREKLVPLIKQARIMSQKYDVVCTNPPYMGHNGMSEKLSILLKDRYKDTKTDMFAVFMEKCKAFTVRYGFYALITQPSWLFLSTFAKLREETIENCTIYTLLHMGRGIFGIDFGSTSFVIRNCKILNYIGAYFRLHDRVFQYIDPNDIQQLFIKAKENKGYCFNFSQYNTNSSKEYLNNCENNISRNGIVSNKEIKIYYDYCQDNFKYIPSFPIAYWASSRVIDIFNKEKKLGNIASPRKGNSTSDNNRFLRLWYEVNIYAINFGAKKIVKEKTLIKRWFPYNKGGGYRKWYGYNEYLIDWRNDAEEIRNIPTAVIANYDYFMKPGLTWSTVTSNKFSIRIFGYGYIFDNGGCCLFTSEDMRLYYLSLMNSTVFNYILGSLNPTLNFQSGEIAKFPIIINRARKTQIDDITKENILISRNDWDSFENSWDFKKHPLIIFKGILDTIEGAFNNWFDFAEKEFNQLKQNEEELNRIFIDIYDLQDELTPEVDDKDITIRKADRTRDIKSFISYAVGCMLGRYSIDAGGLIYAGGEWQNRWQISGNRGKVRKIEKDEDGNIVSDTWVEASYLPDDDNVLPILDDEYFDDDIVARFIEFLKITFGADTLEENLDFIAEILGRKQSETSRQAIRRYFLKDFYKDHVQIYKKRPIYWLFDSGKEDGFKALIYMHRYNESTVARVRTDYLHKLQKMYDAEVKRLDILIDSDVSQREKAVARKKKEKVQKQIQECIVYDQVIAHMANQRISIDLDDGVKVNYAKFQGVEIPQGEGKKPLKANLLAKI